MNLIFSSYIISCCFFKATIGFFVDLLRSNLVIFKDLRIITNNNTPGYFSNPHNYHYITSRQLLLTKLLGIHNINEYRQSVDR